MRSTGRIPKEVPILLIGDDLGGTVFSERTKTVVLSLHGAGILSKHKLSPEQELILRLPERNKEAEIRVVGQIGSQKGIHTYGVAFVDPKLNFWEIDFPSISPIEREMGLLSLVCSSCKTLEQIDDSSIEADICATNDGVVRFCRRCGTTTLWKPEAAVPVQEPASPPSPTNGQMALFPPAAPAVPSPDASGPSRSSSTGAPSSSASAGNASYYSAVPQEFEHSHAVLTMAPQTQEKPAPPEQRAAPRVNRRKHPRVKVNYSACVRHPQRGEDIVLCEDMSKGGLRFKSRKHYYAQSLIEVAAPYQVGQAAIFVPAQIVYIEELPEQQLFRYGVQYLKPTKARDSF